MYGENCKKKMKKHFFIYYRSFCLAKPTESLNFIKTKIDNLANDKLNIDKISFKKDSGVDFYRNNPNIELCKFVFTNFSQKKFILSFKLQHLD